MYCIYQEEDYWVCRNEKYRVIGRTAKEAFYNHESVTYTNALENTKELQDIFDAFMRGH